MALPLNKPSDQLYIELVNVSNNTRFTQADLNVGPPAPFSDPEKPDYNTQVVVSGTGTTSYVGPDTLYHHRLDLELLFAGRNSDVTLPARTEPYTLTDVLDVLNDRFVLGMSLQDFDDQDLPVGVMEPLVLTARASSLTYIGEVTIDLTIESEVVPDLTFSFSTTAPDVWIGDNVDRAYLEFTVTVGAVGQLNGTVFHLTDTTEPEDQRVQIAYHGPDGGNLEGPVKWIRPAWLNWAIGVDPAEQGFTPLSGDGLSFSFVDNLGPGTYTIQIPIVAWVFDRLLSRETAITFINPISQIETGLRVGFNSMPNPNPQLIMQTKQGKEVGIGETMDFEVGVLFHDLPLEGAASITIDLNGNWITAFDAPDGWSVVGDPITEKAGTLQFVGLDQTTMGEPTISLTLQTRSDVNVGDELILRSSLDLMGTTGQPISEADLRLEFVSVAPGGELSFEFTMTAPEVWTAYRIDREYMDFTVNIPRDGLLDEISFVLKDTSVPDEQQIQNVYIGPEGGDPNAPAHWARPAWLNWAIGTDPEEYGIQQINNNGLEFRFETGTPAGEYKIRIPVISADMFAELNRSATISFNHPETMEATNLKVDYRAVLNPNPRIGLWTEGEKNVAPGNTLDFEVYLEFPDLPLEGPALITVDLDGHRILNYNAPAGWSIIGDPIGEESSMVQFIGPDENTTGEPGVTMTLQTRTNVAVGDQVVLTANLALESSPDLWIDDAELRFDVIEDPNKQAWFYFDDQADVNSLNDYLYMSANLNNRTANFNDLREVSAVNGDPYVYSEGFPAGFGQLFAGQHNDGFLLLGLLNGSETNYLNYTNDYITSQGQSGPTPTLTRIQGTPEAIAAIDGSIAMTACKGFTFVLGADQKIYRSMAGSPGEFEFWLDAAAIQGLPSGSVWDSLSSNPADGMLYLTGYRPGGIIAHSITWETGDINSSFVFDVAGDDIGNLRLYRSQYYNAFIAHQSVSGGGDGTVFMVSLDNRLLRTGLRAGSFIHSATEDALYMIPLPNCTVPDNTRPMQRLFLASGEPTKEDTDISFPNNVIPQGWLHGMAKVVAGRQLHVCEGGDTDNNVATWFDGYRSIYEPGWLAKDARDFVIGDNGDGGKKLTFAYGGSWADDLEQLTLNVLASDREISGGSTKFVSRVEWTADQAIIDADTLTSTVHLHVYYETVNGNVSIASTPIINVSHDGEKYVYEVAPSGLDIDYVFPENIFGEDQHCVIQIALGTSSDISSGSEYFSGGYSTYGAITFDKFGRQPWGHGG